MPDTEPTPEVEEVAAEAVAEVTEEPVVEAVAEVAEEIAAEVAAEPTAEPVVEAAAEPAPKPKAPRASKKVAVPEPVLEVPVESTTSEERTRRKVRQGKVVSNKMEQTVVVAIASVIRHPLYGKTMRRTTKLKAHDQNNECGVGDTVEVMETRPLSKEKRWRMTRIIERAK